MSETHKRKYTTQLWGKQLWNVWQEPHYDLIWAFTYEELAHGAKRQNHGAKVRVDGD